MQNNSLDVRWKQRWQNFDRAFVLLRSTMEEKPVADFSRLEQEGLIQRFEYTYELAWKVMKDYLEKDGVVLPVVTPRSVIKAAFAAALIADGQVWIDMMLHRNLLAHTYDLAKFLVVLEALESKYMKALAALHSLLLAQMVNEA